jgi:hypothetical protein
MDAYSAILLFGMVSAGLSAAGLVADRILPGKNHFLKLARVAGLTGALSGLLALRIHSVFGHAIGSPEFLKFGDFLRAHPAPIVTFFIGSLAFAISNYFYRRNLAA